jgi:hypothetical protein
LPFNPVSLRVTIIIKRFLLLLTLAIFVVPVANAQHSVARQWNEALLHAIRNDYARPTVHARNLWHSSILMYDAWAAYTSAADNFFLGDTVGDFYCPFNGITTPANVKAAQEEAMSYAMYRLIKHRFSNSPGSADINNYVDSLFNYLGYDPAVVSVQYTSGPPAALGNFLAQEMIAFGFQDSSNEQNDYDNIFYSPVNGSLAPVVPGNPNLTDPNRWQPLTLNVFIDQSGNVIPISTPKFLSPEWGWVTPFALDTADRTILSHDGHQYPVFHNVPDPPRMDTINGGQGNIDYEWGFRLVTKWSAHLDTTDNFMIDISPASIGNVQWYPSTIDSLPYFYDEDNGGDPGVGWSVNPATGQPYTPQMVRRGDYARVLAEFWADGPDSETPPGHWFTLLNYVNDHPQFEKRWRGQGPILPDLEWDVKSYFTLGGTVHDAAVAAWALKGYHDYLRPISALRWMASLGQSSDSSLPSYHPLGVKLDSGYVALVDSLDPLADSGYVNVGKIKFRAWAGPDSIADPKTDMAGVDWILAENWWPYQRPSFVTPPFAGFVSGHSTFSRAAADVMTYMTGDEYFPGGMGEFLAEKNKFLVFEEGPSTNITLQWATYQDASDQCSLSRIWGGIHPPADDIPGRILGMKVGKEAFELARTYWENGIADLIDLQISASVITDTSVGKQFSMKLLFDERMDTNIAPSVTFPVEDPRNTLHIDSGLTGWSDVFHYTLVFSVSDSNEYVPDIDVQIDSAMDANGGFQRSYSVADLFTIDTENPFVNQINYQVTTIADANKGPAGFSIQVYFNEALDTSVIPTLSFPSEDPLLRDLSLNSDSTGWQNKSSFRFAFDVADNDTNIHDVDVKIANLVDIYANNGDSIIYSDQFSIDTRNPKTLSILPSIDTIDYTHAGKGSFYLDISYDEAMDPSYTPDVYFPVEDPLATTLNLDSTASNWVNTNTYRVVFDVDSALNTLINIDVNSSPARDTIGNMGVGLLSSDLFSIIINTGFATDERDLADLLIFYPNPVRSGENGRLIVPLSESDWQVSVFDVRGVEVAHLYGDAGDEVINIPSSALKPGFYLLKYQCSQFSGSLPFIIRN